jgi:hypothetical protein
VNKFPEPTRSLRAAVLLLFALCFIALTVSSYTQKSGTFDEPYHLASGYAALKFGNHQIDIQHPPLVREWCALPLLAMRGVNFDTNDGILAQGLDGKFSKLFLYQQNDPERLLNAARFMTVLLGVLLGVLLFCWAEELCGFWPATGVLGLYCIEPNMLAQASLVTTDFGVTCFFFGTAYFLWRLNRCFTAGNLAGTALFFALAVAGKFSAVLLIPVVLVLLAVRVWRRSGWPVAVGRIRELQTRVSRAGAAALVVLVLAAGSWLTVWAAYGFHYEIFPGHKVKVYGIPPGPPVNPPKWEQILDWTDQHRLLPKAYTAGFVSMQQDAEYRRTYLAGNYSYKGWWYFFPVVLLVKASSALLLLAAGGLLLCAKGRRTFLQDGAFILVPAGIYFFTAMGGNIQLGIRHILPVFPFLFLLAGLALAGLVSASAAGLAGIRKIILLLVVLLPLTELAMVYPHYLAFFNVFVGGPRNGSDYLVDCNLDWGQDLILLKRWMVAHDVQHINLSYYGTADPAAYGITNCTHLVSTMFDYHVGQFEPPRLPGYVAVSVSDLRGFFSDKIAGVYRPLLAQKPVAVIGFSIYVYWVERPWW